MHGAGRWILSWLAAATLLGTGGAPDAAVRATPQANPARTSLSPRAAAFLDTLERRTFRWFWELSDSKTGLTPDRAPTPSFVSVGAIGFALTAYPIGAERGYVTRRQA